MTARISLAGIIAGVLLVLFGIIETAMLYFMGLKSVSVAGTLYRCRWNLNNLQFIVKRNG